MRVSFVGLAAICMAATTVAQTCSNPYSGTPGDAGWLQFINCGQATTPPTLANWPPASCPTNSSAAAWPNAGPLSFPSKLDTGYGPTLTPNQIYAILSLVWVVENGGDDFDGVVPWWKAYGYIQNIGDGRGYTTNIVGFCTGTGDAVVFLRNLEQVDPCNPLVRYIPDVAALSAANSDRLTGLEGFAVHVLAQSGGPSGSGPINPAYIQATWNTLMDAALDGGYWGVAMAASRKYNLGLPISKGQLFDIALNAGNVDSVIRLVATRPPTPQESGGPQERLWLADLQKRWINLISEPSNQLDGGQNDRGVMWQHLLDPTSTTKNSNGQLGATNTVPLVNLDLPMAVNCYGSTVKIQPATGWATTAAPTTATPAPTTTTSPAPTKSSTPAPTITSTPAPTKTPSPTTTKATTASPTPAPVGPCGNCTNCYYAPSLSCFVGWTKEQCASVSAFSWCGA